MVRRPRVIWVRILVVTLAESSSALQGPFREEFAPVLTRLHKKSGLKPTELAKASELPREYVWRLENGERTHPTRRTVERLAMGLRTGPTPPILWELVPLYLAAGLFPNFMDIRDLKEPE